MIISSNTICKKLSFGYDLTKRNHALTNKQKSTLILSGGEQTINFNLTQEEDEENEQDNSISNNDKYNHSDDEMEVGEEIPAENT
jgi:hypothetical protein